MILKVFFSGTPPQIKILYLDLDSGIVKQSHHAQFDKAWYLQDLPPPTAQLLYDLGVMEDAETYTASAVLYNGSVVSAFCLPVTIKQIQVPWPPSAPGQAHGNVLD